MVSAVGDPSLVTPPAKDSKTTYRGGRRKGVKPTNLQIRLHHHQTPIPPASSPSIAYGSMPDSEDSFYHIDFFAQPIPVLMCSNVRYWISRYGYMAKLRVTAMTMAVSNGDIADDPDLLEFEDPEVQGAVFIVDMTPVDAQECFMPEHQRLAGDSKTVCHAHPVAAISQPVFDKLVRDYIEPHTKEFMYNLLQYE